MMLNLYDNNSDGYHSIGVNSFLCACVQSSGSNKVDKSLNAEIQTDIIQISDNKSAKLIQVTSL